MNLRNKKKAILFEYLPMAVTGIGILVCAIVFEHLEGITYFPFKNFSVKVKSNGLARIYVTIYHIERVGFLAYDKGAV